MKKIISLCVLLSTVGLKIFASAVPFQRSAPIPFGRTVQDDREEFGIPSMEDDHFSVSKKFDLSRFTPLDDSWTNPNQAKLRSGVSVRDTSTNNTDTFSQQSDKSFNSEFEEDDESIRPYKRLEVPLNSGFKSSLPKNRSVYFEELNCDSFESLKRSKAINPRDNFQPVLGSWTNPTALVPVIRLDGSVSCPCPLPLAPVRLFSQDDVKLIAEKIKENRLYEHGDVVEKNTVIDFIWNRRKGDYEVLEIRKKFKNEKEPIEFFIDAIVRYMTLNPKQ